MQKAPPASSKILYGQGSREASFGMMSECVARVVLVSAAKRNEFHYAPSYERAVKDNNGVSPVQFTKERKLGVIGDACVHGFLFHLI